MNERKHAECSNGNNIKNNKINHKINFNSKQSMKKRYIPLDTDAKQRCLQT